MAKTEITFLDAVSVAAPVAMGVMAATLLPRGPRWSLPLVAMALATLTLSVAHFRFRNLAAGSPMAAASIRCRV